MPKSAQQILEEYRGIGYEDRTRRNSLLSNASAGLSKMAGEINDSIELAMEESRDVLEDNEIDEMGMEFKADFFKLSRFADALSTVNQLNSGEDVPSEKALDNAIKVLSNSSDIGELLNKTIDEETAAFYNMPELSGKTYLESIPIITGNAGEEVTAKQFTDGIAFANNYLDLGLDLSPIGVQSMTPEQREAENRVDPDMFGSNPSKYGVDPTPATGSWANQNQNNYGQNPYQNQNNYGQNPYQNQNNYGQNPYQSQNYYNQNPYQNQNNYGQNPYQNQNNYGQNPYQNQNYYGQNPYQNQNNYGQNQYQNQNYYGQNPYQNQNNYGQNPYQNQNNYGQNPYQNQNNYGQNPYQNQNNYGQNQYQNQKYYGQNQNNYARNQQTNRQSTYANNTDEIDVNRIGSEIRRSIETQPYLKGTYDAFVNAALNIAKMPGNEGLAVELRDQLRQKGFMNAYDAQSVVNNIGRSVLQKYNNYPDMVRNDIETMGRVSNALSECLEYERRGLHAGSRELGGLQSTFGTRSGRLSIDPSEYRKARTDLDNYIAARNDLGRNYEAGIKVALESGDPVEMGKVTNQRQSLENRAVEAERTLRTSMTAYMNKVTKNGTRKIDQMGQGADAARAKAGNGVLGFVDRRGLTRDMSTYMYDNGTVRQTSFSKMNPNQRTDNGNARRRGNVNPAPDYTRRNDRRPDDPSKGYGPMSM